MRFAIPPYSLQPPKPAEKSPATAPQLADAEARHLWYEDRRRQARYRTQCRSSRAGLLAL